MKNPQEQLDFTPVTFGKYKGQTPENIAEHDPSYVCWMHREVKPTPCSDALAKLCKTEVDENNAERDSQDEDLMKTTDMFDRNG